MAPKDTNIPQIPISLITLEHMEISMTVIKTEWSITFHTHNIIRMIYHLNLNLTSYNVISDEMENRDELFCKFVRPEVDCMDDLAKNSCPRTCEGTCFFLTW